MLRCAECCVHCSPLYWQNLHWSMKPSSSCNCYIIIITRHNVAVCSTRHEAPEQRLHPPDNVNRHRPLWRPAQAGPVMGKKSKFSDTRSWWEASMDNQIIILQCWRKLGRGSRIRLVCHISLVLSFNIRYLFFVGAHSHQSYTLDVSGLPGRRRNVVNIFWLKRLISTKTSMGFI